MRSLIDGCFTDKEAQRYLGLSERTLRRYRRSGALAWFQVAGRIYYTRAALFALVIVHPATQDRVAV